VPVTKSKPIIAGITGAVTGAPVLCDQIIRGISQYADHSRYVDHLLGVLALVAAVCVGLTLTFTYINKQNARN
jgi:hypothetical protein